ncbi:MAG: hypothetical protein HY318_11130, partial [Armatimonadetes bacterium]|nr:hypothetical protein [Armatimonadota bacterium]
PDPALEDWVLYSVEDRWLHVGTRQEFKKPLLKREVIWAGQGEEPAKKTLIAPPEGSKQLYYSRKQALRALVVDLRAIGYGFDPLNQPREYLVALHRGTKYFLRLERGGDPDYTIEFNSMAYNLAANIAALREVNKNITPRKTFKEQWLVHATGHGTYSGPVKDDMWMSITSKPNEAKKTFEIPDGMGGTFGYGYDKIIGPFTDNYQMVPALKRLSAEDPRVKQIGLYGEDRGLSVDDIPEGITPIDRGSTGPPLTITLKKVTPTQARPGDTLGVIFLGKNVEPGCSLSLGKGTKLKTPAYFGRDANSDNDQWQATLEIDKDAELGKRTLTVTNSDGGSGTLPQSFEIVEEATLACPPIKLILPAAAREWVSQVTSDDQIPKTMTEPEDRKKFITRLQEQRDHYFEAFATMETARTHQENYSKELCEVLKDLAKLDPKKDAKDFRDKFLTRLALENNLREEEASYAKGMMYFVDAFSEGESASFAGALREHALCLSKNTQDALDEMRKWNYVAYWEDWRQKQKLYDVQKENLLHTLRIWQNFNAARLGKLDRRINDLKHAQIAESGSVSDPKALLPDQRALRDVFLDMGLGGLLYSQAMVEEGVAAQDSYLASYKATDQQAKNVELANDLRWQAEQTIVFSLKYMMSLGWDGWKSVTDSLKRCFNWTVGDTAGLSFSTASSDVSKALDDSRKNCDWGIRVLSRVRGYSDEQTIALKKRSLSEGTDEFDQGLNFLANDLNFFTQTDGGLRRLAACYDVGVEEATEDEYLIAIEHARRVVTDMRRTANAFRGAEKNDDFTNWRKLLTEPMQVVKTLTQGALAGGAYYTNVEDYIQQREQQIQEMEGLLPALQKAGWSSMALEKRGPKSFETYKDLRFNNPYFLEWDLLRERLLRKQLMANLDWKIRQAWENFQDNLVEEYNTLKRHNEHYSAMAHKGETARVLQLQGNDRMMVWDYDGALERYYQAYEMSDKVQSLKNVEELREKLVIKKIQEARLDLVVSVANTYFMSRIYQGMGEQALKGLRAAGLVRIPPMRGGTPKITGFTGYVSCFADKVWGALNPFKDVVKAMAVDRNWKEIQKALTTLDQQLQQVLYAEVIRSAMMNYLDVKHEYADFVAMAVVSTAMFKDERQGYDVLITELMRGLKNAVSRYPSNEFSIGAHTTRGQARRAVGNDMKYLNLLRQYLEMVERNNGDLNGEVARAHQKLKGSLEPLELATAKERLKGIETATDPKQRLQGIAEFFRDYPLVDGGTLRNFISAKLKEKASGIDDLNAQINELRFELFQTALSDFVKANPKYKELLSSFIPIGAAGRKGGSKKSMTDIDYTAWLKENATDQQRLAFQADFEKFFDSKFKISLAHLDTSIAAQLRPAPNPVLESIQKLLALGELPLTDPAQIQEIKGNPQKLKDLAAKLDMKPETVKQLLEDPKGALGNYRRQLEKETQRLVTDYLHKEIYFDRANEWLVNMGALLFASPKSAEMEGKDLANLSPEEVGKLFNDLKNLKLEPWMAFNELIGQLGFCMRHTEPATHKKTGEPYLDEKGKLVMKDPMDYNKYASKYFGARGLLGAIMMSARGRALLQEVTTKEHVEWKRKQDPNAWQSMEEIIVDVARYLVSQPGGMKELGLPPLKSGDEAAGREHYLRLFDMWLLRKNGAPPEVVASRAMVDDAAWHAPGGPPSRLKANDPRVNRYLAEQTQQTEGFFRNQIARSLIEMGTEMAHLEAAAEKARQSQDPIEQLKAEVYDEKLKNVFFNLANAWFRMRSDSHDQVVREALELTMKQTSSIGDDWLYALASVDHMGERVRKPDGKLDLDAMIQWKPKVFKKDDKALQKLVEQYRSQARQEAQARLIDSKLGAAWD